MHVKKWPSLCLSYVIPCQVLLLNLNIQGIAEHTYLASVVPNHGSSVLTVCSRRAPQVVPTHWVPLSGATLRYFIFSDKAFEPAAWAAMIFGDSLYMHWTSTRTHRTLQILPISYVLPVSLNAVVGKRRHGL
jgi:hypothetical protein